MPFRSVSMDRSRRSGGAVGEQKCDVGDFALPSGREAHLVRANCCQLDSVAESGLLSQ